MNILFKLVISATNEYFFQELSKVYARISMDDLALQKMQKKQDIFIKSSLGHQRLAQTIWNVESKPNEHINKLILKIDINQA